MNHARTTPTYHEAPPKGSSRTCRNSLNPPPPPSKPLSSAKPPSPNTTSKPTLAMLGHTPMTAGTFRKKFWRNSGKTPETLSELFLEFPSRVRLGSPKPYNSRHLKAPEHFQNSLPPSTARDASFFRSGHCPCCKLRGPAAILLISNDTFSVVADMSVCNAGARMTAVFLAEPALSPPQTFEKQSDFLPERF